jgi:Uma2 family endonuclease
MSAVLTPPKRTAAVPLRWTVTDFHRVRATGAFGGRRPVLLRGILWEQGEMNPPHATAILVGAEALRAAFGAGWTIRPQLPLVLSMDTDPLPDFAVVPGGLRDHLSGHPTTASLVVEVSDTTFDTDVTEKAELYATAGVADYWVVDVDNRKLLVFRDPAPLPAGLGATAYRTRLTFNDTDSVSPLAMPSASVKVADLLP